MGYIFPLTENIDLRIEEWGRIKLLLYFFLLLPWQIVRNSNLHLKKHKFVVSQFCQSAVRWAWLVYWLSSNKTEMNKTEIKVPADPLFSWGSVDKGSIDKSTAKFMQIFFFFFFFGQNAVQRGYRIKVPTSFLAVSQCFIFSSQVTHILCPPRQNQW